MANNSFQRTLAYGSHREVRASGITFEISMSPEMPGPQNCFIVLYRWRVRPDAEQAFVEGWTHLTELLRARGSLGSRLHRGSDGLWYSYAQWPSVQKRKDIFSLGSLDDVASAKMKSAVVESFPEIILQSVADYIVPLGHGGA
ncbi:MAG TPA: antibiotic biosynthesis monooxygenase [Rhodanobacteraceae bacterium]